MSLEELDYLSDDDKKDLVESVLTEVGISYRSINKHGEMIIPCTISNYHGDQDKHPTASINYHKLLFNCLGCQSSGTLLWYIAQTLDLEGSKDSLQWIKKEIGINQVMDVSDMIAYIDKLYASEKPVEIPTYSPKILLEWIKPNHWYFGERGIPISNALEFQLGYNEKLNRVVIPHYFNGKLVGWQTRTLTGKGEKYKNSPDFPKDTTIFNYKHKEKTAIVVESNFSVIKHEAEDIHLESVMGAQVTDEQVSLLARHHRVYLFMDNDRAGWHATQSLYERLKTLTDVWVINSPYKGDPADLPSSVLKDLVRDAAPACLWTEPESESLIKYVQVQ